MEGPRDLTLQFKLEVENMVKLVQITENNFLEAEGLRVAEAQRGFLDRAVGILARGYAYRACNAKVFGVALEGRLIGLALVRDLDEEPACYELQQFMVDEGYQAQGHGTAALRLILAELEREGKYGNVEVCVHKNAAAALRVYEKLGFQDTGYIDPDVPDSLNLRYAFPNTQN